jgi:hypothetical protein
MRLGLDTPILMFDGSIRLLRDIYPGDQIMGINSESVEIQSIIRGSGELCKAILCNGEFVVFEKSCPIEIDRCQIQFYMTAKTAYGYAFNLRLTEKIADNYKYCSIESRKIFLAGLIDRYGLFHLTGIRLLDIPKRFHEDIVYMAQSIGLYACVTHDEIQLYGQILNTIPCKFVQSAYVYCDDLRKVQYEDIGVEFYGDLNVDKIILGNFLLVDKKTSA